MNLLETVSTLFGDPTADPAKTAEAAQRFSDDVVMYEGGDNLRTGEHRGRAAFDAHLKRVDEAADHYHAELQWISGDDSRVVSVAHATGKRNGVDLDTHVVTVINGDDRGYIAEVRDLPFDWKAWDEFWAR